MNHWPKLVVLALAMMAGTSEACAQTTLRFKFPEGGKFSYVLTQKMKVATNVMGKDIEFTLEQTVDMTWQVLLLKAGGVANVKLTFTGAKMTLDGSMGKIEVDGKNPKEQADPMGKTMSQIVAAMADMDMTFTIDGTGDIKDIKIPDKVRNTFKSLPGGEALGDLFTDENLKKMAHGGIVFPKEAVTMGKTWTQKTDLKLPLGQVKGDIEFTYEGAVDKEGKKLEKIQLKPNVAIEPSPEAQLQMKFKSQHGKGTIYFDNDAGRIAELSSSQTMEITVVANNMPLLQKIEQTTLLKLVK